MTRVKNDFGQNYGVRCESMIETHSRRERKKQETRQRMLEAAWNLFRERGYEETTVEEITEAADVAKGTFFNYFETKEAVLGEIMAWRIDLLRRQALSGEDVPESAVARIKLLIHAMVGEFSPKGDLARHLFMSRISAPIRHQSAHRLGSLTYELVGQGQARGEIRDDVDPGLVTRLLMTCFFFGFDRRHHPRSEPAAHGQPAAHGGHRPATKRQEHDPAVLEAKVMQSVDALMSGLGGEGWQESSPGTGPDVQLDRGVAADLEGRES